MLLLIPVELQSQILFCLHRNDVAAVCRVSRHLHAVAIKILYLKVELRSWNHVDSFFLPGPFFPSGSITATEHAEARKQQYDFIKDLTISITSHNKRTSSLILPRSLRGRNVRPVEIEQLRLFSNEEVGPLLPLLECLNPKRLTLNHVWTVGSTIGAVTKVRAWASLEELTLVLTSGFVPENPSNGSSFFYSYVISATVSLTIPNYEPEPFNGDDAISFVLRLLPSIRQLRILVDESKKTVVDSLLKDGFGGKGPELFLVEVRDHL